MAQQTKPQYKYVQINDFRPGIADNPGANYQPGQAARTNTFRCIANRQGALVPLPRRDYSLNGINYATPQSGHFVINGFFVDPVPVLPVSGTTDPNGRVHNIFLAVQYLNAGSEFQKVELFRQYVSPVTNTTIESKSGAMSGNDPTQFGMSFVSQRINRATPTSPGIPVTAFSNFSLGAPSFWDQWPNDATPTLDAVFAISAQGGLLCSHQGRIVQRLLTNYRSGTGGLLSTTEDLKWTNVNDSGQVSVAQVFSPEAANGYAIMSSMSANELFMLKEEGAVLVSGDLANPTVINLPMVVGSKYGQAPARSTIGLVYGNDTGVWVWAHGDTSQLLSERMSPTFWINPNNVLTGERYRFSAWDDWVCVPNNWLYDTQTKSWWRLEDTSLLRTQRYGRFETFMYADIATYTVANLQAVVGWNRGLNATSYSWQSQPLWETIDRLCDVREIICRCAGVGTIAVTITASNGATETKTLTFNDASTPHLQRANFRVQGADLVVKMVVTGTGGNDAPTVYELLVGYDERQLQAVS